MAPRAPLLKAPFPRRMSLLAERIDRHAFPFHALAFLEEGFELEFTSTITIVVGENGSGKSTLIEALAVASGFNAMGGSQQHQGYAKDPAEANLLGRALRLAWLPRVRTGFSCAPKVSSNSPAISTSGKPGCSRRRQASRPQPRRSAISRRPLDRLRQASFPPTGKPPPRRGRGARDRGRWRGGDRRL